MDFCNRIKNWCDGFKKVNEPTEALDTTVHDTEEPTVNERVGEDDVKINVSTTDGEDDTEVTEILKNVELADVAEKLEAVVNELEELGTNTV
jgi:hypothetical protein